MVSKLRKKERCNDCSLTKTGRRSNCAVIEGRGCNASVGLNEEGIRNYGAISQYGKELRCDS